MRWKVALCLLAVVSFGLVSSIVYGQDAGPLIAETASIDDAVGAATSAPNPGAAAVAALIAVVIGARKFGARLWAPLGTGTGAAVLTVTLGFAGSLYNDLAEGRPLGASSAAAWGVIGGAAAVYSLGRPALVLGVEWLARRLPGLGLLWAPLQYLLAKPAPLPSSPVGRPISGRSLAAAELDHVSGRGIGTSPSVYDPTRPHPGATGGA